MNIVRVSSTRKAIKGLAFFSSAIFVAAQFLTTISAMASEPSSPIALVYGLYRDFAWQAVIESPENSEPFFGKDVARQSGAVLERYFDAELSSLLVKEANCTKLARGESCKLDFDPIFSSQDPAAYRLSARSLPSGNVEVQFTYPPNSEKVLLEFKVSRDAKGWRITDILYKSHGNRSLKRILRGNKGKSDR